MARTVEEYKTYIEENLLQMLMVEGWENLIDNTIDYDGIESEDSELTLPHPRMHLRAFVIEPLLEIAPNCRIPGRGEAAAWLPAVSTQRIEKLAP